MVSAIIVAAGRGIRMQSTLRKQYIKIAGLSILCHTLRAIDACDSVNEIILIVPGEDIDYCYNNIISSTNLSKKIKLVAGGAERSDSVYNGILAVKDFNSLVLIHDGVRPFIRPEEIDACISAAEDSGAAILGVPVHDTLKSVDDSGIIDKTLPRERVWLAQTPQVFKYSIIKDALDNAIKSNYSGTDDAFFVEHMGKIVKIVKGSRLNIKITTREDLQLAQAIITLTET
jgi:2-C-methyl-D-erythritol 4-phosphate cytidylyltransferase